MFASLPGLIWIHHMANSCVCNYPSSSSSSADCWETETSSQSVHYHVKASASGVPTTQPRRVKPAQYPQICLAFCAFSLPPVNLNVFSCSEIMPSSFFFFSLHTDSPSMSRYSQQVLRHSWEASASDVKLDVQLDCTVFCIRGSRLAALKMNIAESQFVTLKRANTPFCTAFFFYSSFNVKIVKNVWEGSS